MVEKKENMSKELSLLRFPLIVLVIMIHSYSSINCFIDPNAYNPLCIYVTKFISIVVSDVAVPMFFAISGYFYFLNVRNFNLEQFIYKCKKRFVSLFIPYLCWNLIVFMVYLGANMLAPSMMRGGTVDFYNFTFGTFLRFFWDGNSGSPLCYQMWFIRDLLCISYITPILFLCIKRLNVLFPLFLILLWIMNPEVGGGVKLGQII